MIKKFAVLGCFLVLPVVAHAEDAKPAAPSAISPELQNKFSYAIGRDIAKSLDPVRDVVNVDLLKQGFDDVIAGKPGNYSEEELQAAKSDMGKAFQARMHA